MELFEHQKRFLAQNPNKTALVWSCGTGKTRTACEWSKHHKELTLVIVPKPLKKNWEREAKRWGARLYVVTKEEFKAKFLLISATLWEGIIVDEVHNGFLTPHFKSQLSKALRLLIQKQGTKRVLLLSATIYTSSPWNVFQLAYFIGQNWNWMDFNFKYFIQVRMGGRIIPMPKKGVEKALAEEVRKIASVVDIRDCMDVPEQLHLEPEYFSLTAEQTKGIKDNYDPVHIVRYTKQHEIENGVLIGDSEGLIRDAFFETDKMTRLKDLVAENKKIAIVCRYNLQIEYVKQQLGDKRKVFVIQGATKNRDAITLEAEAAEEAIVILQSDTAIGFQLPSFGVCVFLSMSFSYVNWVQTCGRFLRMDKPSKTVFIYLMTEGKSVDQAVYNAIQNKQDFDISLYGKS